MMSRRDWWLGIVLLLGALFAHAAIPRFEYHHPAGVNGTFEIRVDRWTGRAEWGRYMETGDHFGRWLSTRQALWERQQAAVYQQPMPPKIARPEDVAETFDQDGKPLKREPLDQEIDAFLKTLPPQKKP